MADPVARGVLMAADLATAAKALKDRHPGLLAGEPPFADTGEQRRALEALDAARLRLRGGDGPAKDQLSLDVRAA